MSDRCCELLCDLGVDYVADGSKGYYIHPTVILTTDPKSKTMVDEIFGPVLTVGVMHCLVVTSNKHVYRYTSTQMENTRKSAKS